MIFINFVCNYERMAIMRARNDPSLPRNHSDRWPEIQSELTIGCIELSSRSNTWPNVDAQAKSFPINGFQMSLSEQLQNLSAGVTAFGCGFNHSNTLVGLAPSRTWIRGKINTVLNV